MDLFSWCAEGCWVGVGWRGGNEWGGVKKNFAAGGLQEKILRMAPHASASAAREATSSPF